MKIEVEENIISLLGGNNEFDEIIIKSVVLEKGFFDFNGELFESN